MGLTRWGFGSGKPSKPPAEQPTAYALSLIAIAEGLGVFHIAGGDHDPCSMEWHHHVIKTIGRVAARRHIGLCAVQHLPRRPQPVDLRVVQPEDRVVW